MMAFHPEFFQTLMQIWNAQARSALIRMFVGFSMRPRLSRIWFTAPLLVLNRAKNSE